MKKIFIGIDFSKEKFDATVIRAEDLSEMLSVGHQEFINKATGYRKMLRWVDSLCGADTCEDWLFCGENTGGYSQMMSDYLYSKGYDLWIENALSIKRAFAMKRGKSDRSDSLMIAEYAMRYQDKACLYEPLSPALSQLREVFLYRHMLVRHKCSFEVRRIEKRLTQQKSSAKTMISQSSRHILTELNHEIQKCNQRIQELVRSDEELSRIFGIITSMPGVGTLNAVCLMVFTNNFTKFDYNARKIACYYGVAPFSRDSGTSVHSAPKVGYLANKMIKSLLTQAALAAVNFCPAMSMYYHRLVDKGKKPMVALNNVKNKMLTIITAMVKNECKYQPEYISINARSEMLNK